MGIQALKCQHYERGVTFSHCKLEIEKAQDLEELKSQDLPLAYIVKSHDLGTLRTYDELIVDRKIKHKAKGLSILLLGQQKIPLIDGHYSDTGQCRRSVKQLLGNAVRNNDRNIYVIGVADDIFNELWEKAQTVARAKRRKQRRPSPSLQHDLHDVADVSSWLIQELNLQCEVPYKLTEEYIGVSENAVLVRQMIMLAARSDKPVLILGDTGTGKEVIARAIHDYRESDSKGSFIEVNCGGIPGNLLEAELFGYVKGAFTDAKDNKKGLWQIAGNGTLFLDEIGDLHLDHQAKILRALQEGKIRRVGATEDTDVEARVVTATNRNIFSMVQAGAFREDLYYRLRGFLIRTTPLREHPDDIPLLAQVFWRKISPDTTLPQEILDELKLYQWPGNVRELRMVINNLYTLFGGHNLRVHHLKAVFHLEGQLSVVEEGPVSEKDITLHLARCLRHLKRVYEVIDASYHTMEAIIDADTTNVQKITAGQTSLKFRMHELETLCRHPYVLHFHTEQTYSTVNSLRGKMTYLMGLLEKDIREARKYWKMDVKNAFTSVMTTIFREIENLVARSS